MRKIMALAILAVAVMALPAAASVQNIKVSGDIDSTWLVRDQFDLGDTAMSEQYYQNLLLTQTRLRVDADLTDNVSATIALINERVWGEDTDSSGSNDIDLNLAYVTLREMLYSPLTVVIGRQNFAFGNSFVVDSAGTNNSAASGGLASVAGDLTKRTSQDAVRMILDYSPLTIDLVASKIEANNSLGAPHSHDDDVDLFGTNATWELGDDLGTVLEGYFWSKIGQDAKEGGLGKKADTVYMPGVRAEANLLDGLNVSGEIAYQFGTEISTTGASSQNADRQAAAAQVIANYKVPLEATKEYSPMLKTAYTYVSGDSNPSDLTDQYEAWDPMFENQGGNRIYNALFNLTNLQIVTIRGSIVPLQDVTAAIEWNGLWLDKRLPDPDGDGLASASVLSPDGTAANSLSGTTNRKLGDDLALELMYDYTEDVKIGASYSWFFPGEVFHSDNDQVASQLMLNAIVAF